MPQPSSRFQGGPPSLIGPYQHPYQSHPSQSHQGPSLATPGGYLGGSQMGPFGATNGLTGLGNGMGTGGGFGMGGQSSLANHATRMSFEHGGQLHQQQQHPHQPHSIGGDHGTRHGGAAKNRIRDVWGNNLDEEMGILMELVDVYTYVAMDTEFPGIVCRPMGNFLDKSDYHYQTLRVNVDTLKIIQIGIALFNEKGETPPVRPNPSDSPELSELLQRPLVRRYLAAHGSLPYAWQFNFDFTIGDDMANEASIESLTQAGIDFDKLKMNGIKPNNFAACMIPSGLVQMEDVKWLSFHGGYDFGYFTKCLMNKELPDEGSDFDKLMKKWFPTTYDVKHLLKSAIKSHQSGRLASTDPAAAEILQKFEQKSGLEATAESFKIKRLGAAHQAGSDSLLTGKIFFSLREKIFNGQIAEEHKGRTWGLSVGGLNSGMSFAVTNNSPNEKENVPSAGPNTSASASASASAGTSASASANASANANANTSASTNVNGPSTPSTSSVGLVTTPAAPQAHNTNGNGTSAGPTMSIGPMTPGGGGGVFGQFFQGSARNMG